MSDVPAVSWSAVSPSVLHVVLQRPRANALGPVIIDGLHQAMDAADAMSAKVLVISSALEGFFAAGADIKHMGSIDATSFLAYGDELRGALDRLAERISIAAVEGQALGGGLELAMACTFRVAGRNAQFGLPEVRLGLIPGAGGTQRLPRLVGKGRALDIMMTARPVPADEALAIGLVERLTEAGQALIGSLALADSLTQMSQPALHAVRRTVDAAFDMPLSDGMEFEVAQEQVLFEKGEAREGIAAFLDKRPPHFA